MIIIGHVPTVPMHVPTVMFQNTQICKVLKCIKTFYLLKKLLGIKIPTSVHVYVQQYETST